jgi:YD repeat-containing protein
MYAYDARDRLVSKSTPEGTLTYRYDPAGNRLSVRSDSGKYDVSYGYDGLNRLSTVKDNAGGASASYSYDVLGGMVGMAYGNGVSTQYGYDALNRATSLTVGTNLVTNVAAVLASYTYALYPTGNRKSVTERSGRTASWQYDGFWRLTNETIAGGSANGSIAYTYDSVGNRLSRTSSVAGVPSTTSSYDNNDRLMSDSWDPNGNTVQSGANQYAYDSENRLLSLNRTAANYVYDGDGQLVRKTVGGVTTTYLVDDQGWVEIEVENPRCPPLQRRGSTLVFNIENDGTACTSERVPEGWRRTRFFYRDQAHTELKLDAHDPSRGMVRLLSGVGMSGGVGVREACRFMEFFVGSPNQRYEFPRPRICFKTR